MYILIPYVYGLNYHEFTSDAFLALPCDRLPVEQYEYYAISYTNGPLYSHILIVSCEDNTVVQIGSAVVNLNRMQTYFLKIRMMLQGQKLFPTTQLLFIQSMSAFLFLILCHFVIISLNNYPQP